jgi:AraC family transcriptional regulator
MQEPGSIVGARSPKKTSVTQSPDFMEMWQARCVQGYVAVHLHAKISTGDLAKVAQFSLGRFNRTFKASFGCTPRQFVNRLRVARAQNLMAMSSDPLSLIALESGFADQSHFSNCFRKIVGERPAAWRARLSQKRASQRAPTLSRLG